MKKILKNASIAVGVAAAIGGLAVIKAHRMEADMQTAYAQASPLAAFIGASEILRIMKNSQVAFVAGIVDEYTDTTGTSPNISIFGKDHIIAEFPAHYVAGREHQKAHDLSRIEIVQTNLNMMSTMASVYTATTHMKEFVVANASYDEDAQFAQHDPQGIVSANLSLAFASVVPDVFTVEPEYMARLQQMSSTEDGAINAVLDTYQTSLKEVFSEFTEGNTSAIGAAMNAVNLSPVDAWNISHPRDAVSLPVPEHVDLKFTYLIPDAPHLMAPADTIAARRVLNDLPDHDGNTTPDI